MAGLGKEQLVIVMASDGQVVTPLLELFRGALQPGGPFNRCNHHPHHHPHSPCGSPSVHCHYPPVPPGGRAYRTCCLYQVIEQALRP